MNEEELRELAHRVVADELRLVVAALHGSIAELRDDLNEEIEALTERIDSVHSRALKALTAETERRRKP